MATIGTLAVNVIANTGKLTKGLGKARAQVKGFGGSLGDLGGIASRLIGPLAAAAAAAVSLGAAIRGVQSAFGRIDATLKLAQRLGITTEALTGLQHAAELTGGGTELLNKSMDAFSKRLGESLENTGEAVKAFVKLKLSATELAAMPLDQAFLEFAEGVKGLSTQAEKAAVTSQVLSRSGLPLINMLEVGKAGLAAMAAENVELGHSFTNLEAEGIAKANDAMTKLKEVFEGFMNQVAIPIAPAVEAIANGLTAVAKGIKDLIPKQLRSNKLWSITTVQVIAFVATFAAVLAIIPTVIVAIKAIIGALRLLNISQAITMAFSGPAGWAALAAATAIAAGAAIAVSMAYKEIAKGIDKTSKAAKRAAAEVDKGLGTTKDFSSSLMESVTNTDKLTQSIDAMTARGNQITQELRNPAEKYADTLRDLNNLLAAGAINQGTFARATAKSTQEFRNATKAKKSIDSAQRSQGIGALVRGTTAEFSARQSLKRTAAASNTIQEKQLATAQKQLEVEQAIRDSVKNPIAVGAVGL